MIIFSHCASADYRRHIVNGLFRDVIETAWERPV